MRCYFCFQEYDIGQATCPHCGYDPAAVRREPNHLPLGTVLDGRYIIGEVSGVGGFGIVYRAWDQKLETIVAIKEYFPTDCVNRIPGAMELTLFSGKRMQRYQYGLRRFIEEARVMAKYSSHPDIVNVYHYFEANRTAYVVMEFLEGINLDKYMEQYPQGERQLDIETALEITLSICNALKAIHKDGILHRDISPDNIFLCMNDCYKLYDFGAARLPKDENKPLAIILKPGYAPPEQYETFSKQGAWTDIYALGATLYEILTGVKPPESTDRKGKIENHEPDPLQEPIVWNPEIPQYVNNAIMKAMAIEPYLRFQRIEDLETILRKEKVCETVAQTVKRRKNIRFWGAATAILLFLAGGGGLSYYWILHRPPTATIDVWYIENEELSSALTGIQEDFHEKNPTITVNLVGIPEEDFTDRLSQAQQSGSLPALFQSTDVMLDSLSVSELDSVFSEMDTESCYYLTNYRDTFLQKKAIPVGFSAPVIYKHKYRDEQTVDGKKLIAVSSKATAHFEEFNADGKYQVQEESTFFEGDAALLFSDTTDYFNVQEQLPAQYDLIFDVADTIPCSFENYWSISQKSKSEEKAARWFLEYMLSSEAQDQLYIQNRNPAFPLNRATLDETYLKVYSDFEPMLAKADSFTFG
jgi:serine/threonine protein kinase